MAQSQSVKSVTGYTFFSRLIFATLGLFPVLAFASATLNLAFTPATINPGDASSVEVSIFNSAFNSLNSAAVTVNLASGVTISGSSLPVDLCGFSFVSAPTGGSRIILSGGTVPAATAGGSDGTCKITIPIDSTTSGNHTTTIPANGPSNGFVIGGTTSGFSAIDNGSTISNTTPAIATLAVNTLANPSGAISFTQSTVFVGESSQLKIILTNNNATVTLPLTSFSNTLPSGMVVAPTPASSVSCTGTGASNGVFAPASGDPSVTLTGGTIGQGGACTLLVNVLGATSTGTLTDTSSAGSIGNTRGLSNALFSGAITTNNPLTITKATTPATSTIQGEVSTLKITVANASANSTLGITSLTDTLAAGMTLDASVTPSVVCSGTGAVNGSITAVAGTNTISIAGSTIAKSNSCLITVGVTSSAVGSYNSTLSTSSPATQIVSNTASPFNLTIPATVKSVSFINPLTISQTSTPGTLTQGDVATLKITLTNTSTLNTLGITSFTDALASGLVLDGSVTPTVTCTGTGAVSGSITATAGTGTINITGNTIGKSGNCLITVGVTSSNVASYTSTVTTTSPASAINLNTTPSIGLTIPASTATLTFGNPLTVSQTFTPSTNVRVGGAAKLTITVSNASSANTLNVTNFADTLSSGLLIDASTAPTVSCSGAGAVNGTLTASVGTGSISWTGATIDKNNSCTITVYASALTAGSYTSNSATSPTSQISTNDTPPVTLTVPASSATLAVVDNFTISKSASNSAYQGQSFNYTVTINNYSLGAATNVNFSDTLPKGSSSLTQMVLDTGSVLGTGCSGGTFTAVAGTSTVTWTGGTVVAASPSSATGPGVCTITINALMPDTATVTETYNNSLPINTSVTGRDINNAAMKNTNAASKSVSATASLTVAQAFSLASILQGATSTLTVTITNPTATPLTAAAFSETFNTNVKVASVPTASSTCAGAVILATPGAGSFSVNGMTIPVGSCTVTLKTTSSVVGAWSSSILAGAVTNNEGVSNSAAAAKTLTVTTGLSASAAFSPASTGLGGSSRLTITVTNNSVIPLTNLSITNPTQTGANAFVINPIPNASTTCSGSPVITANANATSASMSGATLAAGGTCTLSFDIKTTAGGGWTNTIPVSGITSNEGLANTATVTASLSKVISTLGINKSFSPVSIVGGSPATLQIDITNPLSAPSVANNVSFTDTFPSGMEVYSVPNSSTTCTNGVISAVPSDNKISFSGADIPIGTTCSVYVDITSVKSLNLTNSIAVGALTSQQGFSNTLQTQATLSTLQGLNIEKSFSPVAITPGQTSKLTVRLISTLNTITLNNIAVTDLLPTSPSSMVVAATPNITSTCTSLPIATAGASSVSISGVTLPAQASCIFTVDVTASTVGAYNNTIPVAAAVSDEGYSNQTAANATLNILNAPTVSEAFATTPIKAGNTSVLTITLANNNAIPLTAASLTNIFPSGLFVAATPSTSTTCGGSVTAVAGGNSVAITGAIIPANSNCNFKVTTTSNTPAVYANNIPIAAISTAQGISNTVAANASLTVLNFPTVSKSFSQPSMLPGATSQLTITLGNSNSSAITLSSIFTDTLPTSPGNMVVATPNGISKTCPGTVTATAGSGVVSYANSASIPAGGCTIIVNVTASAEGTYTNNIPSGTLVTSAGNQQTTSSASIAVTNNTPPTANNISATINNNIVVAASVGNLVGTPQAPATISTYEITSVPVSNLNVYCNALQVSSVSVPFTCLASQVTVLPVGSPTGATSFTYTVTDSNALTSAPATIIVNFNTPPIASAVTTSAIASNAATAQSISSLIGTATTSGATITSYTVDTLPAAGTLSCNGVAVATAPTSCTANGLSFLPAGSSPNPVTFTYSVTDSNVMASASALYTIPLNVAFTNPTAANFNHSLNNNISTPAAIGPMSATPQTGATIASYSVTSLPSNATLYCAGVAINTVPTSCAANGLTIVPVGNPTGNSTFTYTATDSNGMVSAAATATIYWNTPPVANAVTTSALNNNSSPAQVIDNLSGTTTTLGATISLYTVSSLPTAGTLYCSGAAILSVPSNCAANALTFLPSGSAVNPVTFNYTVTDSNGMLSSAALYSIPLNTASTAANFNHSLNNNISTPAAIGPMSATPQTGATIASYSVTSLPSNATLYCAGVAINTVPTSCAANGLTIVPVGNPTGNSTFTYTATDSNGMVSAAATATIYWNTPPVANDVNVGPLDNTLSTLQVLPSMSGSATTSGANIGTYTIRTLPDNLVGAIYCNSTIISTIPTSCAANGLSIRVVPGATSPATFTYSVTDTNGQESAPANFTISLIGSPALAIVKTSSGVMTVGFDATYTLQVSNKSLYQASSGIVTVVDTLPAGLDFVSVAGSATTSGWTCTWDSSSRLVNCQSSTVIAPNTNAESIILHVKPNASVISSGNSASLSNSATVSGGGELPSYANGTAPGSYPHSSTDTQTLQQVSIISGSSWVDVNHNGLKDVGEILPETGSIRVEVWPAGTTAQQALLGTPINSTLIDSNGHYSLTAPAGNVQVRFVDIHNNSTLGVPVNGESQSSQNQPSVTGSNGVVNHGVIDNITVAVGATITQQSLPIDPQGIVYDSGTRLPIGGANVTLNSNGTKVPTSCLSGGANPYITSSSGVLAGNYQFLLDFSASGCSTLSGTNFTLVVSAPGFRSPSTLIPAGFGGTQTLNTPIGVGFFQVVNKPGIPEAGDPTTYYTSFTLGSNTLGIVNNNIPLDGNTNGGLSISKVASKSNAEIGDTIRYTITVRNTGAATLPAITLTDSLPLGFKLIDKTIQIAGSNLTITTSGLGPVLTFNIPGIASGASTKLQYLVRVGVGADRGDGVNHIRANAGNIASNEASARVKVSAGVFGTDACLMGKVFLDCNSNGIQDTGEKGAPSVKLWMETGTSIVTDQDGKYSVCGVSPRTHVLKLDSSTLPIGTYPLIISNRNLGDPNSLILDVKNGELIRGDFALSPCQNEAPEFEGVPFNKPKKYELMFESNGSGKGGK